MRSGNLCRREEKNRRPKRSSTEIVAVPDSRHLLSLVIGTMIPSLPIQSVNRRGPAESEASHNRRTCISWRGPVIVTAIASITLRNIGTPRLSRRRQHMHSANSAILPPPKIPSLLIGSLFLRLRISEDRQDDS